MDLYDRIQQARRELRDTLDETERFVGNDANYEGGQLVPAAVPMYERLREQLSNQRQQVDDLEAMHGGNSDTFEQLSGTRPSASTGALAGMRSLDPREPILLERGDSLSRYASLAGIARSGDGGELSLSRLLRGMFTSNWDDSPAELRAAQEGTTSAGGVLVPTPLSVNVIDRARAQARVFQAGARTVPMDSQTLKVPRLTGSSAPAWHAESAAIATGDLVFDAVTFTARTMAFIVQASRELLEDSRPGFEGVLRDDFARQFALELDRAALRGSGTAPEPRGVRNTSGVTVQGPLTGANGGTPANYDAFVDLVQAVRSSNYEPTAIINAVRTEGTLAKLKDTTNQPLRRPPLLDDTQWLATGTTQNPVNLTTGTSNDTTDAYAGDWRLCWIGVRTALEIIPLRERFMDVGNVGFAAWGRFDVQLAQPAAFAYLSGIRP